MTPCNMSDIWKNLPWKKFRKIVFRLQCRIFNAQKKGNKALVIKLQKLLLSSKAAKWLAIRQVTQLNSGRNTAGIDGKTALTVLERIQLFERLNKHSNNWRHKPLKRVYIPKKDGTQRGLGIPTIADRAYQCLIKYALEPYGEAIFRANSYGFRPGRSTHDAQMTIFNNLRSRASGINKRILKMDIEKCFDKIDHTALMKQVVLPSKARNGLFRTIKAGVKGEFPKSEVGTPQGGCVSPLLANLILQGIEEIGHKLRHKWLNGRRDLDAINGIRYADDIIFILKPEDDAEKLRKVIDEFLAARGLKVKEAKTKLVRSTEGFDFLGWNFKVKPNGKYISTPTPKAVERIQGKVKECMKDSRLTLEKRIERCQSIVRGWRKYNQYCDMEKYSLWALSQWTYKFINKHKSYNRNTAKIATNKALPNVGYTTNRFVKVKGNASPYNSDIRYWSKRTNNNYDGLTAKTLKKQKFKCLSCNLPFLPGDKVELHHIDGYHHNWKPNNLEALHRECHQHMIIHTHVRDERHRKMTK